MSANESVPAVSFRSYYWRVACSVADASVRRFKAEGISAALIPGIALFLRIFFLHPEDRLDELRYWLATVGALVLWLVLIGAFHLVAAPVRLASADHQEMCRRGRAIQDLKEENERLKGEMPCLELGEAKEWPNEQVYRTKERYHLEGGTGVAPPKETPYVHHFPPENVLLYRVPIRNDGGAATGVRVRLVAVNPPIAGLPDAVLHKAGDDQKDHVGDEGSRSFPLGNGEQEHIDVISVTKGEPRKWYIYKIASRDALEEHGELNGSYTFTIGAFASNASDQREYLVDTTGENHLSMKLLPRSQADRG